MTNHTVSGSVFLPDGSDVYVGQWTIAIYGAGYVLSDPTWRAGKQTFDVLDDGSLTVSLPATDGTFLYTATFRSLDKRTQLGPYTFDLTTNKTWAGIIDAPTLPPLTPTMVQQAAASASAAASSASSAAASAAATQAVGSTNDTIIAGRINTSGSATSNALSAAYDAHVSPVSAIKYLIRLSLGQSNTCTGSSQVAQIDTADPRVWCWPSFGTLVGSLIQAVDPIPSFTTNTGHIGHVMTSSKLRARQLPPSEQVVIIPIHRGATGFTNSVGAYTWDPDDTNPANTNLYNQAVAFCLSFEAWCTANGYAFGYDVVTWAQGEQDCDTMTQSQYAAKLNELITKLRTDVPNLATTPVVITGMRQAWIASHGATAYAIRSAHVDMARQLTLVSYVDGPVDDGLGSPDGIVHYNADEQRKLGVIEWKARDYAVANVLGTAPLVPHTPTLVQSASTITVTWSHDPGRVTDYNMRWRVNGGSWTVVSGTNNVDRSRTLTGFSSGDFVEAQIAAVNEQGTSAWSATGSFTLVPPPGQVVGVTLGTATQHTQPLTWTATTGATSYLVEYKLHSAGSWTTSGTVTTAAATVAGLSAASSYDYRVTASNTGGSGTVSATATGSTAAPVPPIDDVGTSAFWAYGLRKLRTAYAGYAALVRRSNDNATMSMGFLSTGEADTASVLTWAGANSVYVVTLYDQSGNGHDITNATTTQQPQLINAGTLNTKNGRATLKFSAAGALTASFAGLWAAGSSTQLCVWAVTGASQGIMSGEGSASGSNARFYTGFINGSAQFSTGEIADTGATAAVAQTANTVTDGTLRQLTAKETGTSVLLYLSGALAVTGATYDHSAPATLTRFAIGGVSVGGTVANLFTGYWSEQVAWASALDDASRGRGEANQKDFFTIS